MPILLADPRRLGTDVVPTLEKAAAQRLAEADTLWEAGHGLAAIYLYGYSVEMRIKAAYFRFDFQTQGLDPRTIIDAARRNLAAGQFAALGLRKKPGQHDVLGWAQLLVARRVILAMRYAPILERELVNQSRTLSDRWIETLRYRSNTPYRHEVRNVREVAAWFACNYYNL
jgi:hypothetical protein